MKQYFTKTGVQLTVIQGLGLGDGIPSGVLTLVKSDNSNTAIEVSHELEEKLYRAESKRKNEVRDWFKYKNAKIMSLLTFKQHSATMGYLDYRAKAIKIKSLSKSKKVHALCNEVIEYYNTNITEKMLKNS